MPPEIQDNLGLILIVAVLIYAAWKYKQNKTVAPAAQQGAVAPAPIYLQSPAAPDPDLVDLHIRFQDRREREVKRQLAEQKLDQMALYEDTLKRIGQVMTPPKIDPK